MSIVSEHTKAYTTFSGTDIVALFDDYQIMTMQGIAVSITREKVPVYSLGSAMPRSISRGKRGIAGTLQFVLFDRDALYTLMQDINHQYYAHADEINWLLNTTNPANFQASVDQNTNLTSTNLGYNRETIGDATEGVTRNTTGDTYAAGADIAVARSQQQPAQYMDQILPFDCNLICTNEYGNGSFSAVIGCEIINEGGGISVDDITSETQATYIALHRVPWTPLEKDEDATGYWASRVRLDDTTGDLYSSTSDGTVTVGG